MNKKLKAVSTLISVILLVVVATIIAIGVLNWGNQFTNKSLDRTDGILDTRKHIENQIIVNSFVAATSEKIGHLSIKNLSPNDVTINGYTISDNEGNIQEITLDSEIEIVTGASAIIPITTILTGTKVLIVLNNPYNYFSLSSITKAPQERPKVSNPTSNLLSGEVPYLSEVNLSTLTNGAIIRYTVDETEPTEESLIFSDSIVITDNLTLKAKAFLSGWITSDTVTFNYQVLTTGKPVASLESGYVPLNTEITLIPDTENDMIYYTTDGTDPTDISNRWYSGEIILIEGETTLKLIAMRDGYKNSDIVTYEYLLDGPKQLALGENHSCVVLNGGKINCWGYNNSGQLGNNDNQILNSKNPVLVSTITKAKEISSGDLHTCALLETGEVACWGDNTYGQLGQNDINKSFIPIVIPNFENVIQIVAGGNSTCAINSDKNLYCWGDNTSGQLGIGGGISSLNYPAYILSNIDFVDIGINHACAINLDSNLYCWGDNTYGQLGHGNLNSTSTPRILNGTSMYLFRKIEVGKNHTCAILSTPDNYLSSLYCWGDSTFGQIGQVSGYSDIPVFVFSNIFQIYLGSYHGCVIITGKEIIYGACFGKNNSSQLALPQDGLPHFNFEILNNVNQKNMALGEGHTCSLVEDNISILKIYCWGDNRYGQVGVGAEDAVIETESNVTKIIYS